MARTDYWHPHLTKLISISLNKYAEKFTPFQIKPIANNNHFSRVSSARLNYILDMGSTAEKSFSHGTL